VEVSALRHPGLAGLRGPAPLLRLQSDERLVGLVRRGHQAAFEVLVARYQSRLLAFCRHMLASREDAEDVLQEVFTAAFNAMVADEREINVRPWLYRIARNRSLNHLRRVTAVGVDSMDVHFADAGQSTGDKVLKRESFRLLMEDVSLLAESQRTALLLREMDALSYQEIAEAMETTIPSVKSLLVRARVSLAEAAEARKLTCEDVRLELGHVAEGLRRISPPVRRHTRDCESCAGFRCTLRANNRAMAAVFPVAPLLLAKKLLLAKLGTTASAGGATAAGAGGAGAGGATAAVTGATAMSTGAVAIATKAVAGLAAAAIVTAGAVEVHRATPRRHASSSATPAAASLRAPGRGAGSAPPALAAHSAPLASAVPRPQAKPTGHPPSAPRHAKHPDPTTPVKAGSPAAAPGQPVVMPTTTTVPQAPVASQPSTTPAPAAPTTQQESDTTVLPSAPGSSTTPASPAPQSGPAPKPTTGPSTARPGAGASGPGTSPARRPPTGRGGSAPGSARPPSAHAHHRSRRGARSRGARHGNRRPAPR